MHLRNNHTGAGPSVYIGTAVLALTLLCVRAVDAQAQPAAASHPVDIALTYTAEYANPVVGGGNFWLQGGSVEVGIGVWKGLAIAGNVTGTHSSAIGPQRIPLSLLSATVGPRYRLTLPSRLSPHGKQTSVFAEAMVGQVHGFQSVFPSTFAATPSALALAAQIGGGIDVQIKSHLELRPLQASWIRSQLPNGTTNIQNDLRLASGLVFNFGK